MNSAEALNLPIILLYFIYGLAFFILGVSVALEVGRPETRHLKQAMHCMAAFGLLHGSYEWFEMFTLIAKAWYGFRPSVGFEVGRLFFLGISFIPLISYGLRTIQNRLCLNWQISGVLLFLYGLGVTLLGWQMNWQPTPWFSAGEALARYTLALPGALLTTWGILRIRQTLLHTYPVTFTTDMLLVAGSFFLYGTIGQMFIQTNPLFPSNLINAETFQDWFGFPIQLLRTILGITAALFTIRALRTFEYNRQQTLDTARQRVEEERERRDAIRQELLHRIVEAQEEERGRIARELHDELGQMLTGLAIGLRGARVSVNNPARLQTQLGQLEEMAVRALSDMRLMVTELRPALLDDVGLAAALRHYVDNFRRLTHIRTTLIICHDSHRLPPEIETALFRITQESLTNVARHAEAGQVWIDLICYDQSVDLQIQDDGRGFDPTAVLEGEPRTGWGLLGIRERVQRIGGNVKFQSEIGVGTTVIVEVPLLEGGSRHNGSDQGHVGRRS